MATSFGTVKSLNNDQRPGAAPGKVRRVTDTAARQATAFRRAVPACQAQVGAIIGVRASYTDQQGTPESVLSAATGAVGSSAPPALPFYHYTLTASGTASQMEAMHYDGPVGYLLYEFAAGEAVLGTASNDVIHLGAGDDMMNGGMGSNFLSGGAGRDVFFLDGRNGETTWSTITDREVGEKRDTAWDTGAIERAHSLKRSMAFASSGRAFRPTPATTSA